MRIYHFTCKSCGYESKLPLGSPDFEELNLTRPQKELIQALTDETMLYNIVMSNEEIIAILSDIIRNIATRHAYGNSLDWGKRQLFFKSSEEKR